MKISEMIAKLQSIQNDCGDIPVTQYSNGRVIETTEVEISFMRILSKRETKSSYWNTWSSTCNPENKGEEVIHIH